MCSVTSRNARKRGKPLRPSCPQPPWRRVGAKGPETVAEIKCVARKKEGRGSKKRSRGLLAEGGAFSILEKFIRRNQGAYQK